MALPFLTSPGLDRLDTGSAWNIPLEACNHVWHSLLTWCTKNVKLISLSKNRWGINLKASGTEP